MIFETNLKYKKPVKAVACTNVRVSIIVCEIMSGGYQLELVHKDGEVYYLALIRDIELAYHLCEHIASLTEIAINELKGSQDGTANNPQPA